MGFKTQRQYTTSLEDYEKIKESVYRSRLLVTKCDFSHPDEKGNFTFYLKKYPDVRIQVTSKQFFLKLHGLKPDEFLLDLKVIREFTSLFKDSYLEGISFKLDKESLSYNDQHLVNQKMKRMNLVRRRLEIKAKYNPEDFANFKAQFWKHLDTNVELHNSFALEGCNFYAECLCEEGFRCKPDGLLEYLSDVSDDPFVNDSIRILLKSGFM